MRTWPALVLSFPPPPAGAAAASDLRDLVSADLDGLDVVGILERADGSWQVSFRDEAGRAEAAAVLETAQRGGGLLVRPVEVADEDWARRSQAALRAVRVGRVVIAPPWDAGEAPVDPDLIRIVIEPAMGFGSGHHATTRLCLAALQRLSLDGRRVLDIGTGSGVLALASARLGASAVLGIDVDPDALDNARANAALNGNPPEVRFRHADFRHASSLRADIVVANLTGGMLLSGAAAIERAALPGGALVLSGITAEERDAVYRVFELGFRMEWSADEDGWCCALLRADM